MEGGSPTKTLLYRAQRRGSPGRRGNHKCSVTPPSQSSGWKISLPPEASNLDAQTNPGVIFRAAMGEREVGEEGLTLRALQGGVSP